MLTTNFRNRCENLAIHYRHKLGLQGYDPLFSSKLAYFLDVPIYQPANFLDGALLEKAISSKVWHALMVVDSVTARSLIIYNPSHTVIDCEESVTHELAHYILGHKPEKLGAISTRFASRFYPKLKEEEADLLTQHLKFPSIARDYGRQTNMSHEDIMAKYQVSVTRKTVLK